ncbi:MAG: phospho-sugar mutase [Solobacterium sp.]|nr:phospho-sugar mutase [Solobacterium sp.]
MSAKEQFERWMNHPNLDPALKEEMGKMDPQQINDAFYTNIEFGTAGMRGVLGAGTNRINIHTIRKATLGFANYINANGPEAAKRGVAIGYDNRHMSREFAFDSAKVLAANGIQSYVFDSLRPTPELSFAVRHHHCFGGIMITASHNPREYNGYKLYDELGCQLVPALADAVIKEVNAVEDELSVSAEITPEQEKLIRVIGEETDQEYYKMVKSIQLNPDVVKDQVKIVFSPEHGTSNIPVRTILGDCGYQVIPVLEQCDPNPDFANTPTPNPEQPGAYELALKYAAANDADIILVCDPDADRMGVVAKRNGELKLMTGNQSGALLIEYIFNQLTAKGKMPENPVMFNTVVTGDLGEMIAAGYGVETEKTLTGFKFIGEKVAKYEKNHEKNYVFGYEESYGSLIAPFVRDKDAPQACLMLAEAACWYKAQGKTLWDVLEECYDKYGHYFETQTSVTLAGEAGAARIKEIMNGLRVNRLNEISGVKVIRWQDFETQEEGDDNGITELTGFTVSNVLKYFLEDGSWIAIRPSGTEPKVKVYYCIKGNTEAEAEQLADKYIEVMKKVMA